MQKQRKGGLRSRQERIANEILMHFRARKKQSCEVSLAEPIDSDKDGNVLSLVDVISSDDNMLEQLELSERQQQLIHSVNTVLDERERQIIILRYGLFDTTPLPQREVAIRCGISRSYVSQRRYCKRFCFQRNAPLTAQSLATTGVILSAPVPGTGSEG